MASVPFLEDESRLLTPEAFEFILSNELKRAARAQNFLTLVHLEPVWRGMAGVSGERDTVVRKVAHLISRDLRETDLLSHTAHGRLSVVLLDADLQNALPVIDRVLARLEHYGFHQPLTFEIGAACCPMHGTDVESLKQAAESRPLRPRGSHAQ